MAQHHLHSKSLAVTSNCSSPGTSRINHDPTDSSTIYLVIFWYTILQTQIYPLLSRQLGLAGFSHILDSWGTGFCSLQRSPCYVPCTKHGCCPCSCWGVTQNEFTFATAAHFLAKLPTYLSSLLSSCCNTRD